LSFGIFLGLLGFLSLPLTLSGPGEEKNRPSEALFSSPSFPSRDPFQPFDPPFSFIPYIPSIYPLLEESFFFREDETFLGIASPILS